MPKTTINEHGDSLDRKNNVRFAGNRIGVLPPSVQVHSFKHGPKALFEFCAFALDGLHGLPSVVRVEVVAHSQIERVAHWATDADTGASHFQLKDLVYAWQSKKWQVHKLHRQIP